MKKIAFLIVFPVLLFWAQSVQAQTVSGILESKIVRRGTTAKGKIILEIPDELHVNSSIPESEFMIPTTVKLSGSGGIRFTKLKYPKGVDRKFEYSETPLNVYEKRAVMDFSFFIPRTFRGKTVKIRAVVGYQACTSEVCYPPRKEVVLLTAKIK